jgi:tripartite-type tricarboxylate transporter receptor subunit TctC
MGFLAPAGTPGPVVVRLNAEINKALALPELRQVLARAGIPVVGGTPEQFGAVIHADMRQIAALVKASGARVE